MKVRIYKPAKHAMQSGMRKTKRWIMEFEGEMPRFIEPMMGWTGSPDTSDQLRMVFDSLESALQFAEKKGLAVQVIENQGKRIKPKAYADNFRFDRVQTPPAYTRETKA